MVLSVCGLCCFEDKMPPRKDTGVSQETFDNMVAMHKEMMETVRALIDKRSSETPTNQANQSNQESQPREASKLSVNIGKGHPPR